VTNFIRYRSGASACYGILDGDTVREIRGDLFGGYAETGAATELSDVALLHPCQPGKILASA
jgi:hypothetical protein